MIKIPKKQLDKWNRAKRHGDGKKIAEAAGGSINEMDISRAFKLGRCSEEVYEAISAFYKDRLRGLWNTLLTEIQTVAGVKARKEFEEANGDTMDQYFELEEAGK